MPLSDITRHRAIVLQALATLARNGGEKLAQEALKSFDALVFGYEQPTIEPLPTPDRFGKLPLE